MNAKVTGIIGYLGWIGWLIAFLAGDKEGAKFHLNQALVINIASILVGAVAIIPLLGWLVSIVGGIFIFVCWLIGIINAIQEIEKELPLLGRFKLLQ